MKKLSFLLILSALSIISKAQVENTDISTKDNVVYMNPVTIAAGQQQTLSVMMKNTIGVQTVQFDMILPDGVRVVLDGNDHEMFFLSTERTTETDMNAFTAVTISAGHYRVLINSTTGKTFNGTDGEIVKVTVKLDPTVPVGDYPIMFKDILLVDTGSNGYETSLVQTTLTVLAAGEVRTVLDETSTTPPADASNVNVLVKRTLKANDWSTICLPFEMSATQWKSDDVFGEDAKLMEFTGYDTLEEGSNVTGITINFSEVAADAPFLANHPYVIKVSSPISEFQVDNVDVVVEDEPTVATVKRTRKQWSELIGTYVANTVLEENTLFLSGNNFYYSKGLTKMKAFRAYFDLYDVLTDVEEASVKAKMDFNDESTSIVDLKDRTINGNVYSVDGLYYGKDVELNRLPKGVYIVNGKKVVKQ